MNVTTTPITLEVDESGHIINTTCYVKEAIGQRMNGNAAPWVKLCGVECNGAPVSELLRSTEHKEGFDAYWFQVDFFGLEDVNEAAALIVILADTINAAGATYNTDTLAGMIAAHNLNVYQHRNA